MSGVNTRGVPTVAPSGDWMLVSGVRMINNEGRNYGRNYIVLERVDGTPYQVASEGDGHVSPPVSEGFLNLRDRIVQIVNDAAVAGGVADLRQLAGTVHDPICLL